PPEVKSLSPGRVPRGGVVTLRGKGFSETSEVLFVASESAGNSPPAEFRVVSDAELEVEIPEQHLGDAHLVVINPRGATLIVTQNELSTWRGPSNPKGERTKFGKVSRASPARRSANPVTLVAGGGIVKDAGTHGIYFVEKGGRVSQSGGNCVY